MNTEQIRHFIAVADNLSFSKAAKQLYIAQPGLSQSIARLENKIGVKLFERNRHSVKLTRSGEILYKEAQEMLDKIENTFNRIREENYIYQDDLKIGFLPTLGAQYLPQWLNTFSLKYPDINVYTRLYTEGTLFTALSKGNIDLAYGRYYPEMEFAGVRWEFVATETPSFVVSEDHPYAGKKKISFEELSNEPLILMHKDQSPEWHKYIINYYTSQNTSPNIVEYANRMDELFLKVGFSQGISIVSSCAILQGTPNIRFIRINNEDAKFKIGMAWNKDNHNKSIKLFINLIKDEKPFDKKIVQKSK